MFSFFRRQGKKQGGGSKKSKKPAGGGFEYINDIQCVPVDKYQVDFCKPFNDNTPLLKPLLAPLIIMGNSESAKKCSTESLDAGYQSDSPTKLNNNMYSPKEEAKNTEFRWESSTAHQIPKKEDNFGAPANEQATAILKNAHSKADQSPLSRAKDIFFKNQTTAPTTSSSCSSLSADASKISQPPLAVQEDLDTCDCQIDVNVLCDTNVRVVKLNDTVETRNNNFPNESNCDHSGDVEIRVEPIRFADSDEENASRDDNETEKREPLIVHQQSVSSSICSNTSNEVEDDDEAFQEVENIKEDDSSTKRDLPIPNITITESSDSDGENESDDDFQTQYYPMEQRYDRVYPTILYDITEVEEPFSDASDMDTNCFGDEKRNFVQEPKFQEQIIKSLKCELETKDTENIHFKGKINDLQRDVLNKTWGMDRLHAELASFQTETDCVRKKLLKVEDDLVRYKNKNKELNEELLKTLEKDSNCKLVDGLQSEAEELKLLIRNLQKELEAAHAEKQQLQMKLMAVETEKNERLKTMEIALNETLKQKQKLQAHFDAEYEKLRTLNSDREQQLVDDFEWKLREVEINCKQKLEEKNKANEEKIKQIRKQLEVEIAQLREQMKKVEKLKSYEAEAIQLRGLTQEQERSLRMATRTADQLHSNQRCLSEEIDKLRNSLEQERAHLATVQGIHSREIAEKDRKYAFRLEQQKNEINAECEDKIRRESTRLKLDIEKQYKDEKRKLLDEAKSKYEQHLKENNEMWNNKLVEYKKEVEVLDKKLAEKEKSYREELVKLQTNSDRDMVELRRKLDKMDLRYQEQMERKQEQHETEIDNLREEYEKKIQQSEQNWAQQVTSTRATLELVKEQLQRETETQIEALNKKYMVQLEQQHDRLIKEKEDAVAQIQEKCSKEMCDLQNQLNEELTVQKNKEIEMLNVIDNLKLQLTHKTNDIKVLQERHDTLQNIVTELTNKMTIYDNLKEEADNTLKNKEAQHFDTLSKIRERYEDEIKQLKLKLVTLERNIASTSEKEHIILPELSALNTEDTNNQSLPSNQSKSSRRRNRGRHRNQQKNHQHPQLTHQFSL